MTKSQPYVVQSAHGTKIRGRNLKQVKDLDGTPLTRKVVYGCQMVILGQGHFLVKEGLPLMIPPVVRKGY